MRQISSVPSDMQKGTVHKTNKYGNCYIIEYVTSKEVVVGFPGYCHTIIAQAGSIRRGQVKNVMFPAVWGVGYLGVGKYSHAQHKKAYKTWSGMLERSYSEKCHLQYPTYVHCLVTPEWHNFQVFAEWYYQEAGDNDDLYLDKDIIKQGNKIYGPETCALVAREVNNAVTDHSAARGEHKLGVTYHKSKNRFGANYSVLGKRLHIGYYSTENKAHEAYKQAKYAYLKELAGKQKNEKVKQGLLNWVIPEY